MKQRFLAVYILLLATYGAFAQNIGIGTLTPDASAALDISNTGKGLLIPRMSTASINAITNPAKGLLVYDSVANRLMVNIGTPAAPSWQAVAASAAWSLGGNTGINPSTQFVGSTDNQPLRFRVNNIPAGELHPLSGNVFWSLRAGQSNTTGFSNIAIGTDALKLNTVRNNLVAIGDSAMFNNGTGSVLVKTQQAGLLQGNNRVTVETGHLASGMYMLSVEWNNGQMKKAVQVLKR